MSSLAAAAAARRAKILARGSDRMALLMNGQTQLPPPTNTSPVVPASSTLINDTPQQTPETFRPPHAACDDVHQQTDNIKLSELALRERAVNTDRSGGGRGIMSGNRSSFIIFQLMSTYSHLILFCSGIMTALVSHFAYLPFGCLSVLFLLETAVRTNDVLNLSGTSSVRSKPAAAKPANDDELVDVEGSGIAVESAIESVLSKSLPPNLLSLLNATSTVLTYANAAASIADDVCAFVVAMIITESIIVSNGR